MAAYRLHQDAGATRPIFIGGTDHDRAGVGDCGQPGVTPAAAVAAIGGSEVTVTAISADATDALAEEANGAVVGGVDRHIDAHVAINAEVDNLVLR